ncbi:hypothetical protein AACH06_09525 [Ideonella sp. DXS29W]|uniref:Lipoprotein n=1 Tax=Ideonella lacteola TaxID=2984193 RepID=A0ABU9BMR4_9BURK
MRAIGYNSGSSSATFSKQAAMALTLIALAVLAAACGGGGSDTPTTEPPVSGGGAGGVDDSGGSTGPTPQDGPDALYFRPTAALAAAGAIDRVSGGSGLFAAWNPNDPKTALKPGMKIMFFGRAEGCAGGTQGPLTALSDSRLAKVASLTSLPHSAALPTLRWTPAGRVAGCGSQVQDRDGASAVFVNADDATGAVGMLTTSGRQDDGATAFFGPYDAKGQNGAGTNAYITGTFINFRQAWGVSDPLQPWMGSASARVRSQQSLGAFELDTSSGQTVQVKQQMMATFLNRSCMKETAGMPCQIQYLFNTAIARSGVSDWSQVAWFKNGDVWFDPAQGGIPIVDGPIYTSGTMTVDSKTRLPLFVSQGSATQHVAFSNRVFDVTIDFSQLMNVLRIVAARKLGVDLSSVTDEQLTSVWGSGWNHREDWVLLSGHVGQEVYNPNNGDRRVQIGGGFRSLYVGPQG